MNSKNLERDLRAEAFEAGLGKTIADYQQPESFGLPDRELINLVRHLLRYGVIVALDEFQFAESLGVVGRVNRTIDDFQVAQGGMT